MFCYWWFLKPKYCRRTLSLSRLRTISSSSRLWLSSALLKMKNSGLICYFPIFRRITSVCDDVSPPQPSFREETVALHWKLVYFAQKVFSTLPPPPNKWQVLSTKCRFAITAPSLPSARTSCGQQVVDKKWPGDVIKKTHTLWRCADYCYSSPLAIVSDHLCSLYNASMIKTGVQFESRK